jgi:6-phosphofructokinase 1
MLARGDYPPKPPLRMGGLLAPAIHSPMARLLRGRASSPHYVHESDRVLLDDTVKTVVGRRCDAIDLPSLEPGGPRQRIYFDPARTRAGIVTCGGLCPGLNNVIRGVVLELGASGSRRRSRGPPA